MNPLRALLDTARELAAHPVVRAAAGISAVLAGVTIVQNVHREQTEQLSQLGEAIEARKNELHALRRVIRVYRQDHHDASRRVPPAAGDTIPVADQVSASVDRPPVDDVDQADAGGRVYPPPATAENPDTHAPYKNLTDHPGYLPDTP